MEKENNNLKKFIKISTLIKDEKQLEEFYELFLTSEERKDIAQRLEIVFELLKAEKPQREIAKKLNTSIAKITRGSNCLKTISSDLKNALSSLTQNQTLNT
ncbi:MAG: trp operon repressor [Lentisphaerota bacterium]